VIAQPTAAAEAAVRARLLALGFSESISSTFASQAESDLFFAGTESKGTIAMENPLSDEATLLRPSLVPGMVTMLANNLNRDVREVRLFEQGQVFSGSTERVHEAASLSLGLTGAAQASALYPAADAGFYELKGAVESLLSLFDRGGDHAAVKIVAETPKWLEPGRSASLLLGDKVVATFGELTSAEREARKLRQPVFLAEVDLASLYTMPLKNVMARELSRYQAVERDFSVLLPDTMQWQTIAAAIEALAIPEMTKLAPVEVFRDAKGKAVAAGQYALLLRCIFQSNDRTLREEELTNWSSAIVAALTGLGGVLRDGHQVS
jgi:phenylalanyl-tRNA synthetase beta chain